MRIRRDLWTKLATVAMVVCIASSAAVGQTGSGDQPQYYPGKIVPAQPGTYAQGGYRPVAETPARYASGQPVLPPAGANKGRLTQPVMAGPEGVRQASATELEMKPPQLGGAGLSPAFVPPTRVEPQPTEAPVAAPPALLTPPSAVVPGGKPTPQNVPPVSGLVPVLAPTASSSSSLPIGNLPVKQAPSVTVEYEMPESVSVGQPFTYSLIVRNSGSTPVSGVRVEQELPAGAAYVGSEPPGEMAGEGKLGWAIGQIDANGEKRIKVTMKPSEEGELKGRASVIFATAVEAKTKVTRPRVAVTVTSPDVVKVGEKVAFQIKLSNTGTGPAQKIGLRAQFSDGLMHTQGPVIEADVVNLPAGGSRSLTLEVTAGKPGQQQCQLSAFIEGNAPETAKTTVTLVEPQLSVKQTGPTRCLVKGEPLYTIELANPGTATTDPLQVWTVVPEGFEFMQATDGGTFNAANKTVLWKLSGLAAGAGKSVTLRLRSASQADGVVRTVAQATATVDTPPAGGVVAVAAKGKSLEARAETAIKSEGVPALRFEVLGAEGLVEVGKEAVYDIRVSNQGTGPCSNVQLTAELAEGTAATKNDGPTLGRTSGQQILFDPIAQLGVKGEAVYRVRVKGTVAGDMRFRVKLTCDQVKSGVVKEENTRFYKDQ